MPFRKRRKTGNGRNKYHAKKCEVNGIVFASMLEAKYYEKLLAMEQAGEISNLKIQVPYELVPHIRWSDGHMERSVVYKSDFEFDDTDGNHHVLDSKGFRTADYKIKRKLLKAVHNIEIEEV